MDFIDGDGVLNRPLQMCQEINANHLRALNGTPFSHAPDHMIIGHKDAITFDHKPTPTTGVGSELRPLTIRLVAYIGYESRSKAETCKLEGSGGLGQLLKTEKS